MTDYYTDADHIRDTLDKYGPLTRAELADKTNIPRETLAKSLYALKKQGDVIEEGDRLMLTNPPETAQDAPEEAETGIGSAPAVESGTGQESAASDTPSFGDCRSAYQAWASRFPGKPNKEQTTQPSARLQNSLDEMTVQVQRDFEETVKKIQEPACATVQYVHMPEKKPLTPEENEKLNEVCDFGLDARNAVSILSEAYWAAINELSELRKDNEKLRETNNRLLTDSLAYIALKEKLRGMLDD